MADPPEQTSCVQGLLALAMVKGQVFLDACVLTVVVVVLEVTVKKDVDTVVEVGVEETEEEEEEEEEDDDDDEDDDDEEVVVVVVVDELVVIVLVEVTVDELKVEGDSELVVLGLLLIVVLAI